MRDGRIRRSFYRDRLYRELGFETWEELLLNWEHDHLEWDANDLLAKLRTWQLGDISANERYRGDFERALGAIRSRAILVPCSTDLYFPPQDNALEAKLMPNAEFQALRPRSGATAWPRRAARAAASCAFSTAASRSCWRTESGPVGNSGTWSRHPRSGPAYGLGRRVSWRRSARQGNALT